MKFFKKMGKYTGTSTLESMSQAEFYNKWTLSKFRKYLKGEILEIGCGIGNFTSTLSKFGKVTSIDIDKHLIDISRKNNSYNIQVGFGNIEKGQYFFKEKLFDTVVCINVLEHINNDTEALKNMFKLLKKGGNLILLVPIYDFLFGEIDKAVLHFRRYNPDNLVKEMQEIGYTVISHRKLNFIGAIGWFISGRILKNKQITEGKIKLFNLFSPLLYLENIIEPPIGTSILVIVEKE
ncbi:class I SAM-dependent methyltransferase [Candidatus Daviesbacteria bacterium]|nr:class I SAM-dependent methyltransferase [Candidatus Daviesbacteria bacterium]